MLTFSTLLSEHAWKVPASRASTSADRFHAFHRFQFSDECVQSAQVVHHDGQDAREESVVTVNVDAAKHDVLLFGDDGRDVVHDAQVIVAHDAERDGVGACSLACPACFHDAIAKAVSHGGCIRTVGAVDFDAAALRHESKDVIAIDRIAAACHAELNAFQVLVV